MDLRTRIEAALERALRSAEGGDCPPGLSAAMRHAVVPGGARLRPRLCLAVARACGDDRPETADAAAAAIELLHCASLVHDDLPCFDDAELRRGKPSVHVAFGEPLAVLTGDALIVLAFRTLASGACAPDRLAALVTEVAAAVGAPSGIVAGQAWESEPSLDMDAYHRAKTGALFAGATMVGAVAAGASAAPWRDFGLRLGEAYQVADDLRDAVASVDEVGKPVRRDAALGRCNAMRELGPVDAKARLKQLIGAALAAIPDCPGAAGLHELVLGEASRFMPRQLERAAA